MSRPSAPSGAPTPAGIPEPTHDELKDVPADRRLELLELQRQRQDTDRDRRRQSKHQWFNSIGILVGVLVAIASLLATTFTLRIGQDELRITKEGQVTDRYAKAVEQLGSDRREVRAAAVYALERIARDSARDRPAIIDVLAAFTREHDPKPTAKDDELPLNPTPMLPPPSLSSGACPVLPVLLIVIIALTAPTFTPSAYLAANLRDANLSGANLASTEMLGGDLREADLEKGNLSGANVSEADLRGADLRGARLRNAKLSGADLRDADLTGADLRGADLRGARLPGADLRGADLTGADLRDAYVSDADLRGADLTGTDMTGTFLRGTDLRGIRGWLAEQLRRYARTDNETRF